MNKVILILYIIPGITCFSQWEQDMQLTNYPLQSYTQNVAVSGNIIHVVWAKSQGVFLEIFYKKTSDFGIIWSPDIRLAFISGTCETPKITVSGNIVHVVWIDHRNGNRQIYYMRSTNSGDNWSDAVRLINTNYDSDDPQLKCNGSNIHLIWTDVRDGNAEIYYKNSSNSGMNWGNDERLTNNSFNSIEPSLEINLSDVHVVWKDYRDGNGEIYYKSSQNSGLNWSADKRLTYNSEISGQPAISVSSAIVHIVWTDAREIYRKIFYKKSIDGGISWGSDILLSSNINQIAITPDIIVSGNMIHVVWGDTRNLNYDIYYKQSTDIGNNWTTDYRLTADIDDSHSPNVIFSGNNLFVFWYDNRTGHFEIFYKKNPIGNTIGINNISADIPEVFNLEQNFPNPFNPSTKIKFHIPISGLISLEVFDLLGRNVSTLVDENLKPGVYEVDWDASSFPSGVYYYKLRSVEFSITKKLILIK